MEMSPSQEAASYADAQKLPSILWSPKIHYHVHKSPPLVQSIPPNPISTKHILIFSTHLCLVLPDGLFPS
jgi:hypothetical protein